ncbi:MAG: molybdate ABC transporter permease subunit [Bacteriovoracaceae bacterium]
MKLSIEVGLLSIVIGFPFALFFGWVLARKNFKGKSLINLVLFMPLSLPPVVTGLILLELFGRESYLGKYMVKIGLPLSFSQSSAILAALVVGFPFYVMMIRSAFESVDVRYEEMAQTVGLTPLKIFLRVSLPLAFPGIIAGSVIAFARGMGEFGATSILAGNIEGETRTISLAVYSLLENPKGGNQAKILVIISLIISFISLALYEWLLKWHKKRLEISNG